MYLYIKLILQERTHMLIRMGVILGGVEDRLQKILKAIFEHKWFHGVLVALILVLLTAAACGTQPLPGERAVGNSEMLPTNAQTTLNSAEVAARSSGLNHVRVVQRPRIANQM